MDIVICEPVVLKEKKSIMTIGFRKLEIRVNDRDYMLTSYESTTFEFNIDTFEILEGNNKFSFMHGKEIIVTVKELCEYGNNAQILCEAIEKSIVKQNQLSWVPASEMDEIMGDLFKMHEAHVAQARKNLIDHALETGDKELFERMCRMEVPQCK